MKGNTKLIEALNDVLTAELTAASGNDQRRSDCQDGISLFR
jgi:hypothetical protein